MSEIEKKGKKVLDKLYDLSKGGKEMVSFEILAKECIISQLDLQKIVTEYTRKGLLRYEPVDEGVNPNQNAGIWITNKGMGEVESTRSIQ